MLHKLLLKKADQTNKVTWGKKKGRARQYIEYYKLIYGNFTDKYAELHIDWINSANKDIYDAIVDFHYGEITHYK